MKTSYMLAIGLAAAFLLSRRTAAAREANTVRVGELGEGVILDGTNWTGDLWSRFLSAADLRDPGAGNFGGSANADPGKVGVSQARLAPGWDGSL